MERTHNSGELTQLCREVVRAHDTQKQNKPHILSVTTAHASCTHHRGTAICHLKHVETRTIATDSA